ncbi:capping complex subunit for YIEGIA [Pseudalkalibacillus sp. JSM 102089]|uniref:capping complex subunit for YIEGIA n=1 Tax=Pseudalkalibacillus sp. JSM 102089 TaxID=3229856 RepID=UPI00352506BA
MIIEKAILATVTLSLAQAPVGANVFVCESQDEMDGVAADLEAILDGIAHKLSNGVYIIVKH